MFTVALTGGIGSGKSTVAAHFQRLGVAVFDADEVAREVVEPGQPALDEIRDVFGEDVIGVDGTLQRRKLREIVFAEPTRRAQLEAILHPRIRESIRALIEQAPGPYCVVCIPLLFETDQANRYDRVLVVDVPEHTQINRTILRDDSPRETIEGILAAQIDRVDRLRMADDVLDNSGDPKALRQQVAKLHACYLALAGKKS